MRPTKDAQRSAAAQAAAGHATRATISAARRAPGLSERSAAPRQAARRTSRAPARGAAAPAGRGTPSAARRAHMEGLSRPALEQFALAPAALVRLSAAVAVRRFTAGASAKAARARAARTILSAATDAGPPPRWTAPAHAWDARTRAASMTPSAATRARLWEAADGVAASAAKDRARRVGTKVEAGAGLGAEAEGRVTENEGPGDRHGGGRVEEIGEEGQATPFQQAFEYRLASIRRP